MCLAFLSRNTIRSRACQKTPRRIQRYRLLSADLGEKLHKLKKKKKGSTILVGDHIATSDAVENVPANRARRLPHVTQKQVSRRLSGTVWYGLSAAATCDVVVLIISDAEVSPQALSRLVSVQVCHSASQARYLILRLTIVRTIFGLACRASPLIHSGASYSKDKASSGR